MGALCCQDRDLDDTPVTYHERKPQHGRALIKKVTLHVDPSQASRHHKKLRAEVANCAVAEVCINSIGMVIHKIGEIPFTLEVCLKCLYKLTLQDCLN